MQQADVLLIVTGLSHAGVTVWVDGGWCVDALVGYQVRDHDDLDIAIRRNDEPALKAWLSDHGYIGCPTPDESPWNYVLRDDDGCQIDVHVFDFDESGNNSYGVAYPAESLTGHASLGGVTIHCIPPDWLFRFKTEFDPRPKDLVDVKALAVKFGFDIPATHQTA